MGDNKESENGGACEASPSPDHAVIGGDVVAVSKRTISPAFQFYPKDFLSSSKVQRMSLTERGVYICLLAHCWLDGSLPDDVPELARLIGMKQSQFARVWASSPLSECFKIRGGRLVNERLETERQKQADYRRRQTRKANNRWKPGNAAALPGDEQDRQSPGNALLSPISDLQIASKKEKKDSSEPPSVSEPTVAQFQVVGNPKHPTWDLVESRVTAWATAYPNVDVPGECRKAAAWIEAHPEKRKTAKGMPAFLVNWLNRTVDRGGSSPLMFPATGTEGRGRTGAPSRGKYDDVMEN